MNLRTLNSSHATASTAPATASHLRVHVHMHSDESRTRNSVSGTRDTTQELQREDVPCVNVIDGAYVSHLTAAARMPSAKHRHLCRATLRPLNLNPKLILKSLATFGDEYSRNGSKKEVTAPSARSGLPMKYLARTRGTRKWLQKQRRRRFRGCTQRASWGTLSDWRGNGQRQMGERWRERER